jgi:hypothetical protein
MEKSNNQKENEEIKEIRSNLATKVCDAEIKFGGMYDMDRYATNYFFLNLPEEALKISIKNPEEFSTRKLYNIIQEWHENKMNYEPIIEKYFSKSNQK